MAQPILLVEILLVALGIIFLVFEFKAPGHIASGVVALLCFAAFFLIHFLLGGQMIVVGLAFFVVGIALLGIEVFLIPGHGVAGICGVVLILAGLVVAGMNSWPETVADWVSALKVMLRHILTMACAVLIAFQLTKYLPDVPYINRLFLLPPGENSEVEEPQLPGTEEAVELLGQVGTATSLLRPSGIAQIGNRRVNVSTEWDFIEPGTPIQVVAVEGTRIVVKKV